jgi:hypothetical protein
VKKLLAGIAILASLVFLAPQAALAQASGLTSAPKITACGTSPTVISDGDFTYLNSTLWGEITTGSTSVTSCTVNFAAPFNKSTYCVLSDRTLAANLLSYTLTTSGFVLTLTSSASQHIDYICKGQ